MQENSFESQVTLEKMRKQSEQWHADHEQRWHQWEEDHEQRKLQQEALDRYRWRVLAWGTAIGLITAMTGIIALILK